MKAKHRSMVDEKIYESLQLAGSSHAIEQTVCSISFVDPLSSADYGRLVEHSREVESLFPRIQPIQIMDVRISDLGQSISNNRIEGYELLEFSRQGVDIWLARFHANQIILIGKEYQGWSDFWSSAEEKLLSLLELVDPDKKVTTIELSVTDKFRLPISAGPLVPSILFSEDSQYYTGKVLSSGDGRWDVQQGWFEDIDESWEMLKRVDCRSGRRNEDHIASVENVVSMRAKRHHMPVRDLIANAEPNGSKLGVHFLEFHKTNKEIMKSLLCKPVLKKMGLED